MYRCTAGDPTQTTGRNFVTTHMDVPERRTRFTVHRREIHHHALNEVVRRLERRVHHVVGIPLDGVVVRPVRGIAEPIIGARVHRLDRGARVSRHLDFGITSMCRAAA